LGCLHEGLSIHLSHHYAPDYVTICTILAMSSRLHYQLMCLKGSLRVIPVMITE